MIDYRLVVTLIFVAFVLVELALGRFLYREQTTKKDVIIELGSGLALALVIVPTIMTASAALCEALAPGSEGTLAHLPAWSMFGLLLVFDDLSQYAWHRLSHTWPRLYMLHRAHHSAEYLSVRVTYRNNIIYYALMPGLWCSGVLLYLGFAPVYYVYYIAKMLVVISAHSSVAWDDHLLKIRWLRPIMWLVQRTISTPSTHSAHHGKHAADGITHYKGNFGNFLFLWDVIFKTAKISSQRPPAYGLENVAPATWHQELLWPSGASAAALPEASAGRGLA